MLLCVGSPRKTVLDAAPIVGVNAAVNKLLVAPGAVELGALGDVKYDERGDAAKSLCITGLGVTKGTPVPPEVGAAV